MPKKDIDSMFDAITITLDSEVYKAEKITQKMLEDIAALGETEEKNVLAKQLAIVFSLKDDENPFANTDIRKLSAAVRFIMETINQGMGVDSKNEPKAEGKK